MFQPRPYQLEAKDCTWKALQKHRSTLVVLPTGCGKTILFSMLADEWHGPVLVLAHRKELLGQAKAKLERQCREPVGIDQGTERASPWGSKMFGCERIVCASVQTICKDRRRKAYDPAHPWLVVIDEAHHATASTYRTILGHFEGNPGTRVVGVTATPKRADGTGLEEVFESAAYVAPIPRMIGEGWLVDVEILRPHVEGLDFSSCRTVTGDLSAADVTAIATQERPLHEIAGVLRREVGGRQGIVFCASVAHVHSLVNVLRRPAYFGEGRVAGADGKTEGQERDGLIARFRSGELQVLVNCGLFVEGLDVPNASWLAMCRPTKSVGLYTQALGRIMRPLEGLVDGPGLSTEGRLAAIAGSGKPRALLLDFCGVSNKHRLADAVDVLQGDRSDREKERARKVIRESSARGESVTFDQAAHRAAAEEALIREQVEWRKRMEIAAEVTYRIESAGTITGKEVSAVTGNERKARDTGAGAATPSRVPPTDGQIRHLVWLGVNRATAQGYTRKQAATVINRLRQERGLPVNNK